MIPLVALLVVTAIWGVTFVQVKDAVAIYPLFAFLAVRFAIASVTLAPSRRRRASAASTGAASSQASASAACLRSVTRSRPPGSPARPFRAPASSPGSASC